ncbi:MAG: Sas10/Utp3/C1D family-domain-containing protein [Linnemannia gamsii]|nr:MAG: Sas10/Utp3/C1D family-domain-containing protein [Linnemannia gamsii]
MVASNSPADAVAEALRLDQVAFPKHLNELATMLKEIETKLKPTIAKLDTKEIDTSKGLSFLEVKYHILLEYITNLAFVMYRKLDGQSIHDHPAVLALVEQRTILEKMKPVEQKLKYQIDKLVRAAVVGQQDGEAQSNAAGADPLAFKPNPKNLVMDNDNGDDGGDQDNDNDEDGDNKTGLYRAPKMAPVHFEEDSSAVAKRLKYQARLQARAAKSRVMKDLVSEFDDRPEEMSLTNDGVHFGMGMDDKQREREEYEESNFTRTMLSKKEIGRLRKGAIPRFENEFENLNDFSQIAPLQDDLETNEQRRRNVLARRNERKQAAMAQGSDDDDDMGGDSRSRKRSHGNNEDGELFDGLMSDPSKRRKGKTAFDRSKRNIGRSKSNVKAKGKGRK